MNPRRELRNYVVGLGITLVSFVVAGVELTGWQAKVTLLCGLGLAMIQSATLGYVYAVYRAWISVARKGES